MQISDIIFYVISFFVVGIFLFFRENYRKNIFYILNNLKLVYSSFFHWNISKIFINIYIFFSSLILSFPLLILLFYIMGLLRDRFNGNSILILIQTGGLTTDLLSSFLDNIWLSLAFILIVLLIAGIFALMIGYGDILLLNLFKGYTQKNKIKYLQNLYFSWSHFKKYLSILGRMSLYLLIPLGILLVGIIILGVLYNAGILGDNLSKIGNIILGAVSYIFLIGLGLSVLYLIVVLFFSYIGLLDSTSTKVLTKNLIKEGFNLMKGNILKFIGLNFPFLIVYSLIYDLSGLLTKIPAFLITFIFVSSIYYMINLSVYNILRDSKKL